MVILVKFEQEENARLQMLFTGKPLYVLAIFTFVDVPK